MYENVFLQMSSYFLSKELQPLLALTTCFLSSRHLVATYVIIHVVFFLTKTIIKENLLPGNRKKKHLEWVVPLQPASWGNFFGRNGDHSNKFELE